MSVPKGKRNQSRFEAAHHFIQLRQEITNLVLQDFGFSEEKWMRKLEAYRKQNMGAPNVEEVCERWEKRNSAFVKWYIDEEGRKIIDLMRDIEKEFTMGNSIYPSETPAKLFEFIERRKHMNNAMGLCYTLKQEINYVIRTLPVDINKYKHFAEELEKQIALYRGVRQSDNRLIKTKNKDGKLVIDPKVASTLEVVAATIREIGKAGEDE